MATFQLSYVASLNLRWSQNGVLGGWVKGGCIDENLTARNHCADMINVSHQYFLFFQKHF